VKFINRFYLALRLPGLIILAVGKAEQRNTFDNTWILNLSQNTRWFWFFLKAICFHRLVLYFLCC